MTTKITLNNIADTALATLTGPKVTTILYPGTETATDVAGDATANYTVNGYINDLRITKGYARYTANFTPPTTAFNGR